MADNKVEFELGVDTKGAEKGLKDFEKAAKSTTESIEKAFGTLKTVALAAVAVVAGKEIFNALHSFVDAAAESDAAVRKLGTSLAVTGEYSDEAVKSFEDFASELQKTTTLTDEAVLGGVSLAKSFGLSNDQAKKLTAAAVDLAAATGKDLDTAIHELGNTFSGTSGRLGKLAPELKNLTEEQLKAGAAIDVLGSKFEGFAKTASQTFGGAVIQTKNAFGEIFESLGKIVTQNPVVLKVIQELGNAFNSIADIINQNRDSISEFLSLALKKVVSFIPTVIKAVNILVQGFNGFVQIIGLVIKGFLEFGRVLLAVSRPLTEFVIQLGSDVIAAISDFLAFIVSLAKAIPGVSGVFKDLNINLDEVQKSLEETQKTAEEIDISKAADEFDNFANDALTASQSFVTSAQKVVSGTTEFAGKALIKLEDITQKTADSIQKVDNSSVKATAGIKNMGDGIKKVVDNSKLLESVKGSFDKVKNSIEELQKEIDKQTLTLNKQVDAELKRGQKLRDNAKLELELTGKATEENLKLLGTFDALINKKAQLAKEKLSFADLSVNEALANAVGSTIGDTITSTLQKGFPALADFFATTTIGQIGAGLTTALTTSAEVIAGIISGQFVKDGLDVVQGFAEFPKQILSIFENADQIFKQILNELPGILDKIISSLPEIAKSLADTIGQILTKIIDRLPEILDSILSALATLVDKLFSDIIPRLIEALPGVIKKILDALPGILNSILSALPRIITDIFKAIPQIIKAIADALPGIIETLAENLPDIVLALVQGLIELMPEIVDALVTSLLIDGGLERIIVALIKAMPRIALAFVQGVVRGLANAFVVGGQTAGKAFTAAIGNIGSKIGGQFGASIGPFFQQAWSQLLNVFNQATGNLFSNLAAAFQQGGANIFSNISNAFIQAAINVYNSIVGAFSGAFATVRDAIVAGAQSLADKVREGANSIGENIRNGAGEIFNKIRDGAGEIFNKIVEGAQEIFNKISDALSNLGGGLFGGGGGGGGGKNISQTLSGGSVNLGFSKGGMVKPVYAAKGLFKPKGTDTVPAVLSPGELVVSKDTTSKLSEFLDAQANVSRGTSGDSSALVVAMLAQIKSLLEQPISTNATATVDGRAFANIILDLSRNNARLSA